MQGKSKPAPQERARQSSPPSRPIRACRTISRFLYPPLFPELGRQSFL